MNLKLNLQSIKNCFYVLGFGAFILALAYFFSTQNPFSGKKCNKEQLKLLSIDIQCEIKPAVNKSNYMALKHILNNYIQDEIKQGNLSEAAIYFRDLQNGPTMGINEYAAFSPASLFKLPVLIAYLGLEEEKPELAETKLVYRLVQDDPFAQTYFPTKSVEENKPYTVDELLRYMIKYSDNRAVYVLLQYLRQTYPDKNIIGETLADLGIIDTSNANDQIITVKSYAGIFVQLYYGSFFDKKEISEKAVEFLADTDFKQGLVAGVPAGTIVAHKFGERLGFEGNTKQLHDCGVVYFPKNPYLLCVMTRGKDFENLAGFISKVSKLVYSEVDSRKQ